MLVCDGGPTDITNSNHASTSHIPNSEEAAGQPLNEVDIRDSSQSLAQESAAILPGERPPSIAGIYPPVPAYSPPSTTHLPLYQQYLSQNQGVDDDFLRYTLAHGHGETAVTQRLPEIYPTDDHSFRSSQRPSTLPAYGDNEPPRYRRWVRNSNQEPQTLAMYFFKFGFFFPVFWVFGALMLITPLRSPDPFSSQTQSFTWPPNTEFIAWCNQNLHTEEDRLAFLRNMQEVEMKWARRCLSALGILAGVCIALGVTIFGVMKAT